MSCPHVSGTLHRCLSQVLKVETIWGKISLSIFNVGIFIIVLHLRCIIQPLLELSNFAVNGDKWCVYVTFLQIRITFTTLSVHSIKK